jgi:ribose/xylose/arabinose/galactoside ABC-type transport system permease subunit
MTTETIQLKARESTKAENFLRWLGKINPLIFVLIILYIGLALMSDRFLVTNNQMNILRQSSVYLIIALGQTLVIASRGIDLSVGSTLGLAGCFIGFLLKEWGLPVPVAIMGGVLLGMLIGTVNGLIITLMNVPPLIATLGMMVSIRGLVHFLMQSNFFVRLPSEIIFIGQGFIGPVPMPVIISLSAVAIVWWLYNHTRFGRYAAAIGSNEAACRLVGIKVDRYKVLIYAFQGALAGLAAAVLVGRLNAASPALGEHYELHIIAAVVLGGTALFGGYGTVLGTFIGILTIGVLENGMVLIGADFHIQRVLIGILLVSAVAYQGYQRRRRGALET